MTRGTLIDPDIEGQDRAEGPSEDIQAVVEAPRSRRALLAGVAAAAGAFVAQAATAPLPAGAANGSNVKVGQTNTGTAPTTVNNTVHSASAIGLIGRTTWTGTAASSSGVYGESKGTNGIGVQGKAATGTTARGVLGRATEGIGVRGQGGAEGVWGTGGNYGVHGDTPSSTGYGVYGTGGGYGVYGNGSTYGVFASSANTGVYGNGTNYGAVGVAGSSGWGVYGYGGTVGVYASGGTYGLFGSGSSYAVYGSVNSGGIAVYGTGGTYGVLANGTSYGVFGSGPFGTYGNGASYGALGYSSSGIGVYGTTSTGYAGWFQGALHVNGTLSKTAGSFMIDHPKEPQRRYLIHSFVEGPERLNVYRGTIKLNSRGRATVRLPRYFGAANKEPSYQLTPVGAAAPSLHIAKEVEGNRFVIAGGAAGQTVCWQVTAARDDAWAQKNPLRVEPLKARADRGKYLNPEVFGRPRSAGINQVARLKTTRVRKPKSLPKPHFRSA
jgi:hypothetical protein